MDLFDDLPEPSASGNEEDKSGNDSVTCPPEQAGSPAASSSSSGPPNDQPSTAKDNDNNSTGVKRKLESDEEEDRSSESSNKKMRCTVTNGAGCCYKLCGYYASRKGERDEMQDTHVIMDDMTNQTNITATDVHRLAYFAVFDGHAGSKASEFAEKHMHHNIIEKLKGGLSQVEREMRKTFVESYKKTDEDFLKEAAKQKPAWKDGTTATTMVVVNNCVYVANIGDSKAILCRENNKGKEVPLTLTKDHSPVVYEERRRIEKVGGVVRDGRVMGVLEVSRSIGDGQFKTLGLTCVPDVKRCQLTERDKYLLIACDGLWKSLSPKEVIRIVQEVKEESSQQDGESQNTDDEHWEAAACNRLANEAVRRLSGDNVTIVIISIGKK